MRTAEPTTHNFTLRLASLYLTALWLAQPAITAAQDTKHSGGSSNGSADAATPPKSCSELIYTEIANSQLCEQLLSREECRRQHANTTVQEPPPPSWKLQSSSVLIAMLPDVDRTPAGEAFDGALGGLISGMERQDYVRDHARLRSAGAIGPAGQLYKLHCPGIILFRARPSSREDGKPSARARAVLTVGEDWHSGIDPRQLRAALDLVEHVPNTPLPILGPYYSASATGFISELSARCPSPANAEECHGDYVAASGSMSSDAAVSAIETKLKGLIKYHTFASTQVARRCALHEWRAELRGETLAGCRPARESDDSQRKRTNQQTSSSAATSLRQESADKRSANWARSPAKRQDHSKPAFPLRHIAMLRLQGTTFSLFDETERWFNFDQELVFPGNVSTLRRAIERATKPDVHANKKDESKETRADRREQLAEDWELIAWREPKHSSEVFRAGIRDAVNRLDPSTDSIWITNERIEDASFLAHMLKQEAPDLRVIIDRRDLALLREDYSTELHGSLVISTYSPVRESADSGDSHQYTLTRDQGFGIFHAVQWLLGSSHEKPTVGLEPTLEVIAGGQLIPLTGEFAKNLHRPEVPPAFLFVVVLFTLLAVADMVRISRINRTKTTSTEARKFFMDIEDCRSETLARGHALMFLVARCSLAFGWYALAILAVTAWLGVAGASKDWAHVVSVVLLAGAGCCILRSTLSAIRFFHHRPDVNTDRPKGSDAWGWLASWLSVCLLFGALALCCEIAILIGAADRAFLARSLDFLGGASPVAVIVFCSFVFYCVSAFYARRLRVLDRSCYCDGDKKYLLGEQLIDVACREQASNERAARSSERSVPDQSLGQRLYCAAARPSNFWKILLALFFVLVAVVATPPLNAWEPGSFTLERALLHWVIIGCLVILTLTIVFLIYQSWDVYRGFSELLAHLAVSDLFKAFKYVAWPRTVTQHLWVNWPEKVELRGALRIARISDVDVDDTDAAYARLSEQIAKYHSALKDVPKELNEKEDPRIDLAGLVAFELANWIRQLTTLMTSVTIATTGLLVCSSLYVFGVRRLMITVSALLTIGAVILAMVMFTTLEHDEVLRKMGSASPDGPDLVPLWRRILTYGVFPLLLLLTTYYPGIWSQLFSWSQAHLPGMKLQ